MPHSIVDSDTNITSDSYTTLGGIIQITCWADTWDGAQIEIQTRETSPLTDTWISYDDTVTGSTKIFTRDAQTNLNIAASGNEIRAVLSNTGGSSSNINCRIRGVA